MWLSHLMHRKRHRKALVLHLVEQSKSLGCYKTMLNATAKNISFYEKMGLEVGEYQMVIRH